MSKRQLLPSLSQSKRKWGSKSNLLKVTQPVSRRTKVWFLIWLQSQTATWPHNLKFKYGWILKSTIHFQQPSPFPFGKKVDTPMGAQLLQSCPTLCNPMDLARQAPLSMGILQARILEWVAMPSSRGSPWPWDQIHVPYILHWQMGSLPSGKPDTSTCQVNFYLSALLLKQ